MTRFRIVIAVILVAITAACSTDDAVFPPKTGCTNGSDTTVGVSGDTGKELAGLSEAQLQLARNGVAIGKQRSMPESAVLAQSVAMATESTYRNLANPTVPESLQYPHDGEGTDHSSVGPHQMKAEIWAPVVGGMAKLMDPLVQIGWFYDQAKKVPGYETMEPAALAQQVERSSANAYSGQMELATRVVDLFKSDDFGNAAAAPPTVASSSALSSAVVTTTAGGATSPPAEKVIAIDPGHGPVYDGSNGEKTDPATGLVMKESPNTPEMADVWDVAQKLKTGLEHAGYRVVLTKEAVDSDVDFRARADRIKSSGAVLAVAIHTSGSGSPHQATPQKIGEYREYGDRRTTFDNADTATKSQQAASIIARSRSAAEGHTVDTTPITFFGRDRASIPSPGDLPFVSLFSDTVPLVYNELGRDGADFDNGADGLTEAGKDKYAKGLLDGIQEYAAGARPGQQPMLAANVVNGVNPCANSNTGFVPGGPFGNNVVAAAKRWLGTTYAWGGGNADGPTKGIADGGVADSYGDFNKVGFDCSGLVMYAVAQASGKQILLPHYDSSQVSDSRGQPITNPSDLQPGDIIQPHPGHIFIWVGGGQVVEAPQSGGVVEISNYTPSGDWKAIRFG